MTETARESDAMREYAHNIGDTEHAWVLTPYDVWVENPNYSGPAQPHPETDIEEEK